MPNRQTFKTVDRVRLEVEDPSNGDVTINLATIPRANGFVSGDQTLGPANFYYRGNYTLHTSGGPSGGPVTFARKTCTDASGGGQRFSLTGVNTDFPAPPGAGVPVKPHTDYVLSAWVRHSRARSGFRLSAEVFPEAGGSPVSSASTPVHATADTWARVSVPFKTGTGTRLAANIHPAPGDVVGDTVDVTGIMLTEGAALLPYFDGSTFFGPGSAYQYAWTGTADRSHSVRVGVLPNLIPNPSGEQGVFGWRVTGEQAALLLDSVPYDTTWTTPGPAMRLWAVYDGQTQMASVPMRVTPGQWVGAQFELVAVSGGRNVRASLHLLDANYTYMAEFEDLTEHSTPGVKYGPRGQVPGRPGDVVYVQLVLRLWNGAGGNALAGDLFRVRRVMVAQAPGLPATGWAYADPEARYVNILGPSHELTITRSGLDASTLSATVLDPALDPAVDPEKLAAGHRVRVTAYLADEDRWEPIYTGKIREVSTAYELDKYARKVRPRITLTAADAAADLANIKAPHGYALSEAWALLEGVSVPWFYDGSSSLGLDASAFPSSTNSNATVLDQLAIARDTELGSAHVDRHGQLQIWQRAWWAPWGRRTAPNSLGTWGGLNATTTAPSVTTHTGATATVVQASTTAGGTGATSGLQTRADPGVIPGQRVALSVWARTPTARAVTMRVAWLGSDTNPIAPTVTVATSAASTSWRELAASLTVPWGAASLRIEVTMADPATGNTLQVDGLTIDALAMTYSDIDPVGEQRDSYTDLDVSFATSAIINSVTVNLLRRMPEGDSEVVTYGPYVDQPSIDRYGAYSATHTVQLIAPATELDARVAEYAQKVLDANANPERTVAGLTVAVLEDAQIRHAVLVDLQDVVRVAHAGLVDTEQRVATIVHHITPDLWQVEYGFAPVQSVATPTATPAPAPASQVGDGWVASTLLSGFGNVSGQATAAWRKDGSVVRLRGRVGRAGAPNNSLLLRLPEGSRPGHLIPFIVYSGTGGNGFAVVGVQPDGYVIYFTVGYGGDPVQIELGAITFTAEN